MNEHVGALKAYRHNVIVGYKKGGGEQSTPTEAKDSLRSKQLASVIDLLCEGPIKGVKGLTGIYLDGVPIYNDDGTANFTNISLLTRNGGPAQTIMPGFNANISPHSVGVPVKVSPPAAPQEILNTDVDHCRVTVSTPQLQTVNKQTGDINGSEIKFDIMLDNNGGGYALIGHFTISGKTSSNYQRAITFDLPKPGPWHVKVIRVTPDSTTQDVMNELHWDTYEEITDDKINYANSAVVGLKIDAEQFRSIPKRIYDVEGLVIRVPTTYVDPDNGVWSGVWDGTFKSAYSNNPAWCFYDLVTNNRYGLGDFISPAYVDKWALYKIGVWCDGRVPGKNGVPERRYQCNFLITNQQEAFNLLAQMVSIFRGWAMWTGGMMVTGCDMPEDVAQQFTNANVIDGVFNYSSTDIRQKHTQAGVRWSDPAQLGQQRLAIYDDSDALSRYGIQRADVVAYGCTRESEAIRAAKWLLYTEQYEDEQINFKTGHNGAYTRVGSIIAVMDVTISGKRRGGRVAAGTDRFEVFFDSPVPTTPDETYYLSCIVGVDARIETKSFVIAGGGMINSAVPASPFSANPLPDSVWVISTGVFSATGGVASGTLDSTWWRCTSKKQVDKDTYEINGVRHYPQKWNYVERDLPFSEPDVSDIAAKPPPVTNLKIIEYLVALSAISVGVRVTLSWTSKAPTFEVYYRKSSTNENWQHVTTDKQAVDLPASQGVWVFQVTPVSLLGIKGNTATLTYTVIGLSAPPGPPKDFRIIVSDGVALFKWKPAPELDVIIGGHFELRHSSTVTGATWNTAQTVIPSIPGSATSVETTFQTGTWFLRTYDSSGIPSAAWATIVSIEGDNRYIEWERICEQPDWLGSKVYTEIKLPQNWLVLGQTGGLWDDQLNNIDDWLAPAVDILPLPPGPPPTTRTGTYSFSNSFDAGDVFPIRFSSDILAFPFADPDDYIDSRMTDCDTWLDWDDVSTDLEGQVTIMIRVAPPTPDSSAMTFGDWQIFTPGEYVARYFEFMAVLSAPAGQNIGVETLCITGDFKAKADAGNDIPYSAINTRVYYGIKFYHPPAVVVTVQLSMAEDRTEITAKTREYFDVKITQTVSGGNPIGARIFDYHAQGY